MIKKTSLKTGKLTQRPGFLIAGSIIFASGLALGFSALAGNMNLPGQNVVSSNALQPGGATQQTQADIGDDVLAAPGLRASKRRHASNSDLVSKQ